MVCIGTKGLAENDNFPARAGADRPLYGGKRGSISDLGSGSDVRR